MAAQVHAEETWHDEFSLEVIDCVRSRARPKDLSNDEER